MVSLVASITATILGGAIWFAFFVLYLAFYAGGMDFWQKAAVFLASGAIVIAIIAVFWARYGLKGTG
jgi:membrane protein DedA with SNARE-associated domain